MNVKKTMLLSFAIMMAGTTLLYANEGTSAAFVDQSSRSIIAKKPTTEISGTSEQTKDAIRKLMEEAIKQGIPGMIIQTQNDGVKWEYGTGKSSIFAEHKMQPGFHFRIGSITKTFTATVVLQLVGEGKLSLDDSIEKWLPGVVQGNGYDGNKITVRQLLNHTSGIASYTDDTAFMEKSFESPFKAYTANELVKVGLQKKPLFAPGTDFYYSNTNYVLAGLVIHKVSGKTHAEEITERLIKPLGMKNSLVPGASSKLPEPHARAYYSTSDKQLHDITEMNPAVADASGDMISTANDLNRFFTELLAGKLLKPEQMKQMLDCVESQHVRYGLGIREIKLANGASVWGHGGGIHGSVSLTVGSLGGKQVVTLNNNYLTPGKLTPRLEVVMSLQDKIPALLFQSTEK
ncbi:serine hydrolase domain-containing protein [Paenibacillus sp. 481]|uniref:serine hydrolase domain-containing protein n=1 Tax=Paenibacillus sp. 481 TaxID=2835869 RepID=UPI001E6163AB|nr:serine hydrolase domain-containing protein [Paenibacillus sp. 481]UHA75544.1 beta-lactamase family protein [Paenibacillus sp. 481]